MTFSSLGDILHFMNLEIAKVVVDSLVRSFRSDKIADFTLHRKPDLREKASIPEEPGQIGDLNNKQSFIEQVAYMAPHGEL